MDEEKPSESALGLAAGFRAPKGDRKSTEGTIGPATANPQSREQRNRGRAEVRRQPTSEAAHAKSRSSTSDAGRAFTGNSSWKVRTEEEVEDVQLPTAEELEAIRKSAYDEGFASGKEQGHQIGYDAGLKKGEQDVNATVARLKQVMQAIFEPIEQQDEKLESLLLDSIISICHLILKRELKIDSSQIVRILREALSSLKVGGDNIKVHLHPRDAELIREKLSVFADYSDRWKLVEHGTLSPGGCIVETDNSVLNASLDERVAQVIQQIYDQEVLRLPGHADEILDKEAQFMSSGFSEVAEQINLEKHTLPATSPSIDLPDLEEQDVDDDLHNSTKDGG